MKGHSLSGLGATILTDTIKCPLIGDCMRISAVLRKLSFGGEVAEHDSNLERYFVETTSFEEIINDEADLILGPKGTGKTAFFRHLSNPQAEIPVLQDVDIVPAFNTQGSPIFRQLSEDDISESSLRIVWFTYIVAMVGNHLLTEYRGVFNVYDLESRLGEAGLITPDAQPGSVWNSVVSLFRRLAESTQLEGSLILPMPGSPRLTGRITAGGRDAPPNDHIDLELILSAESKLLEQLGRRCWLLFDRLDEAFQENRDLERRALRSLLRAHLDILSFGTLIKSKLFLRDDVLRRVTESEGFVNATHLRTHRIHWDGEAIVDLVARRIVANEITKEVFRP
jgi:hypothetical protein